MQTEQPPNSIEAPDSITLEFISGITQATADRLVILSIHVQRMYARCVMHPMEEAARFSLLSLQESSLTMIESLMATHLYSRGTEQLKELNASCMMDLLVEWEQLYQRLRSEAIQMHTPPDFHMVGNWKREDLAHWVGTPTHVNVAVPPKVETPAMRRAKLHLV